MTLLTKAQIEAMLDAEPYVWTWQSCERSQGWNTKFGDTPPETGPWISDIMPLYATSAPDLARTAIALHDRVAELERALQEIANITERKANCYPDDWNAQIEACPECQRYKGHPIQQGICDQHRKPIYAQRSHDQHETQILGYRAQDIARATLERTTP